MKPTKEQAAQPKPAHPEEGRLGSASSGLPKDFDPIESAMKRHPGLTREKAEEMAESFGF